MVIKSKERVRKLIKKFIFDAEFIQKNTRKNRAAKGFCGCVLSQREGSGGGGYTRTAVIFIKPEAYWVGIYFQFDKTTDNSHV